MVPLPGSSIQANPSRFPYRGAGVVEIDERMWKPSSELFCVLRSTSCDGNAALFDLGATIRDAGKQPLGKMASPDGRKLGRYG